METDITHIQIKKIEEVERSISLANHIIGRMQIAAEKEMISQLSMEVCTALRSVTRLEACLLAWCHCRFSELVYVDIGEILDGKSWPLYQPKTKKSRMIVALPEGDIDSQPTRFLLHRLNSRHYDSLRFAIERATPAPVRDVLVHQKDKTHLFRHIHASFLAKKGVAIDDIKAEFSHSSPAVTLEYIHEELFPFV